MYYERVFKQLNKHRVGYLVVGGTAVNLLGYMRLTQDLDLLLDLRTENIRRFVKAVKPLKFHPRVPVNIEDFADPRKRSEWIRRKGAKVFLLLNPKVAFEEIDVLLQSPVTYATAVKRAQRIRVGSLTIPVISIDDLIRMKRHTGRPRDLSDAAALEEIKRLSAR